MRPRPKPLPPDTDPQSDTQGNRTRHHGRQKSRTAWQASTNRILHISAWTCWKTQVSQMRTRTCCKRIRIWAWALSPLVVLPVESTVRNAVKQQYTRSAGIRQSNLSQAPNRDGPELKIFLQNICIAISQYSGFRHTCNILIRQVLQITQALWGLLTPETDRRMA